MITSEPSENLGMPHCQVDELLPTYQAREIKKHVWLNIGARLILAAGLGAALGTEAGIYEGTHQPTEFTLAPGLNAEVWPIHADMAIMDTGGAGNAYLKGVFSKQKYVGTVSAEVKTGTLRFSGGAIDAGAAVISDPDKILEKPVESAISAHIASDKTFGTYGGLALGSMGSASLILGLRRRRRSKDERREAEFIKYRQDYLIARDSFNPLSDVKTAEHLAHCRQLSKPATRQHSLLKRTTATVAGISIAGGALAYGFKEMKPLTPHINPSQLTAVNPSLVPNTDQLKGISVTKDSVLDFTINNGLNELENAKNDIDYFYAQEDQNVERVVTATVASPAYKALIGNPDLENVDIIDGTHCSIPFSQQIEPTFTRLTQASIIANLGNVDISGGNLPLENLCPSLTANAIQSDVDATGKKVYELYALGSHDSLTGTAPTESAVRITGPDGKPYSPNIVLGNHNNGAVTINGLTFVGLPTPRQNVNGHPTTVNGRPADDDQQEKALAQNGDSVEKLACAVTDQTGIAPTGLGNSYEQLAKAQKSNCLSSAFSGEGSWPTSFYNYHDQFMAIEGSSAGNGVVCSFEPYAKPGKTGQVIQDFIDKKTGKSVAYVNYTIKTDSNVYSSGVVPVPGAENGFMVSTIDGFLEKYDNSNPIFSTTTTTSQHMAPSC